MKEGYVTFFGVNWHVYYGSSTPWSDPYGFVESGPLCPKCNYEMDTVVKRKLLEEKNTGDAYFAEDCMNAQRTSEM